MRKEHIDLSYFIYREWLAGHSITYVAALYAPSKGGGVMSDWFRTVQDWIRWWANKTERKLADFESREVQKVWRITTSMSRHGLIEAGN